MAERPGIEQRHGGNVEPADRGTGAKPSSRTAEPPAERFELRDPRTDLTYRKKTFVDMVTKANQLGASRFVAIDAEGKRTTVSRVNGVWQRDGLTREKVAAPEPLRGADVAPPTATKVPPEATVNQNDVDAERAARLARIEATLNERYVIKRAPIRIGDVSIGQTEYRHRGDLSKVAFTESVFRLSTDDNNPSVARSMVDVAEARGWQALRVSGSEDFKRMVWLESSLRGLRTVGFEAVPSDYDVLRKEREARHFNRIDAIPRTSAGPGTAPPAKQSQRGGGRKTVLAALEAVLIAKNVPERQREAVMAAATENLAARLKKGEVHRVKIYDKSAPSRRPAMTPVQEVRRDRERGAPTR